MEKCDNKMFSLLAWWPAVQLLGKPGGLHEPETSLGNTESPHHKKKKKKKVRNGMPEIPALGRPKQEDCELEASLGYILRP
jgi:hypothetical protein